MKKNCHNQEELENMMRNIVFRWLKNSVTTIPAVLLFVVGITKGSVDLSLISLAFLAAMYEIHKLKVKVENSASPWY